MWTNPYSGRAYSQVALYLSTEQCAALAHTALQKWPPHIDAFEHLGMFFGFFTQALSDRLSSVHLKTLRPYLKQLDIHTIMDMVEFCVRHGYREWANLDLCPECDRRRAEMEQQSKDRDFIESMARYLFPTDTDLLGKLDWIEQQQHPEGHLRHIGQWCKEFEQRQDDPSRWRSLLEQWLAQFPSIARLKIVGNAIDAEALRAILLDIVLTHEAQLDDRDAYGQRYIVDFWLDWHGKRAQGRSGWVLEHGSMTPRLTSCKVL